MPSPIAAGSIVIEEGPVIVSVLTWIAAPAAPVLNEVAVTTPVALRSVIATFGFSSISTAFPEAVVITFSPLPVIAKPSVRRSISSEPVSAVTVNAVPAAAVVADVTRPLASTVMTGTDPFPP